VICVTVPVAVALVAGNVMRAAWPSCTFAASASAMLAVTASSLGLAITMKPSPEDVAAVFVAEFVPLLPVTLLRFDEFAPLATSPTLFATERPSRPAGRAAWSR
jgi:hypothetical protein